METPEPNSQPEGSVGTPTRSESASQSRIEKNRALAQALLAEAQSKAPLNRPGLATRPFQRHLNRSRLPSDVGTPARTSPLVSP